LKSGLLRRKFAQLEVEVAFLLLNNNLRRNFDGWKNWCEICHLDRKFLAILSFQPNSSSKITRSNIPTSFYSTMNHNTKKNLFKSNVPTYHNLWTSLLFQLSINLPCKYYSLFIQIWNWLIFFDLAKCGKYFFCLIFNTTIQSKFILKVSL
jgi:hypothetical protein